MLGLTQIYGIALLWLGFTSCEVQRHQDTSKLKASGRKPTYGLLYEQSYLLQDEGFDLTTNKMFKVHTDASGRLTWVQFDTTRGPRISELAVRMDGLERIREMNADLMLSVDDFTIENSQIVEAGNLLSVFFLRKRHSYRVRDEFVQFVYASHKEGTFSLREIINRTSGFDEVVNQRQPKVTFIQLMDALARDDIVEVRSEEILFARDLLQLEGLHLCTEWTYQDVKDGAKYTATIVNGSQEIIEIFGDRHFSSHQLSLTVLDRSYLTNRSKTSPLAFATLLDGNGNVYSTDAEGMVDLPAMGEYTLRLTGLRGSIMQGNQTIPFSVPISIQDAKQAIDVQGTEPYLNAFAALQEINRFARRHLRGDQASILDTDIQVGVGYAPGACNAFYSPGEKMIALFPAGSVNTTNCADTALIHDVLHHEYGHALDDALGLKQDGYGILDGAFSEGIGDIVASYYNVNPRIGEGFYADNANPIRSVSNNLTYPEDLVGEFHSDGQIIGGAFWDLRQALIARYSADNGPQLAEQLFFCHLQTTNAFVDSYQGVLACDDEDGNPASRSRNYCLINSIFSERGLAVREVNCVDETSPEEQWLEKSLRFAIQKNSTGNFDLYLSSAVPVSRAYCCLGRNLSCEEAEAEVEFVPMGRNPKSGNLLFSGLSPILSPEQQELSCFAKDFDGQVQAAALFKVVRK